MERVLVVCAHPDDESLGLGGTISLHTKNTDQVFVLVFATGQLGRDDSKKGVTERRNQGKKACSILGVKTVEFLDYEDQVLDRIPLSELTVKIEKVINKFRPTVVYTHFWGDANQDHRRVYEATLIATRPVSASTVKKLICFEIPASTEWSYADNKFSPNLFVDISKTYEKKLKAIKQYKNEISKYPHPRSEQAVTNRSKYWGNSIKSNHAEAFVIVREIR